MTPHVYSQNEVVAELKAYTVARGQKEVAEAFGLSPQYISDVLRGNRDVSEHLANCLGFERTTVYYRVEKDT